jgi:hypothetical protein
MVGKNFTPNSSVSTTGRTTGSILARSAFIMSMAPSASTRAGKRKRQPQSAEKLLWQLTEAT